MGDSMCPRCGRFCTSEPTDMFDVTVTPGTRHYTLLNTNEPPDDSDIAFIHSTISKSSARIASIDNQITKLRETVKQLEDERVSLVSFRTRNQQILSPFRRIPSEVLGEIFSWTLPSMGDALSVDTFNITRSPWLLTHVSSRWRAVSLSIPSLWSRIIIDYSEDIIEDEEDEDILSGPTNYPLNLAKTLVQRAQKLKIHFYGCLGTESSRQIQMLEFLLQHSSRWEELSLGITLTLLPLVAAFRGQFSSLQRLWIQWEDGLSALEPIVPSIDCFQSASSLLDFGFQHYIPLPVPIQQLTRYHAEGFWEEQMGVLKLALNLREVRIDIAPEEIPLPFSDEIVDLPQLRRLYVTYAGALYNLKASSLEGLGLDVAQHTRLDILPVESFIARSACPLRRLSLTGYPNALSTRELLQRFPFITELVLAIDEPDARHQIDCFMSLIISPGPGRSMIAPQLQCMVFACEDDSDIDYELCLTMLQSRCREAQCSLKTVALFTERTGPNSATFEGLQALRRDGLDLLLVKGAAARQEVKYWYYATSWN
ncbi:F-box domain-containing protein [Mycena sanguinolenta]|uniref:F-box domain-containing protein n=1 Tax=Mycena sanguinolenta TaxID=230812 RepID=A0A8H6Z1Z7_9AGAR|nr:F-box domain-containing protein [Mycena sanguinolenta]